MTLLHPPSSAFHSPISASSTVFAGDSAGANLALSLLQVILFAQRSSLSVPFNGVQVNITSPASVSMLSAGLELTLALPSWHIYAKFDISLDTWPMLDAKYPACGIWPSRPPRGHPYCKISMLNHPLVAPAVAEDWKGSPTMWFADSAKLAAERAAQQGVEVWYEEYKQMPHDFPIMGVTWPWAIIDNWPQSLDCMRSWVEFCVKMFEEGHIESGAVVKGLVSDKILEVKQLTGLSFQEALRLTRAEKAAWKDCLPLLYARSSPLESTSICCVIHHEFSSTNPNRKIARCKGNLATAAHSGKPYGDASQCTCVCVTNGFRGCFATKMQFRQLLIYEIFCNYVEVQRRQLSL